MLLTGLRGVGKTVLLNEIERIARANRYHIISFEAQEGNSLGVLIAPSMRTLIYELDRLAGAGDKARRALAVLRSFISGLNLTIGELSFGLDIEPATGAADTGDIELDLPSLMVAVGEAAEDRGASVAIFIDEIQYFRRKELGALIVAMHLVQQRRLPVVLVGAGLPILPALAGESKSYAERLFNFPNIGALSEADSARAIQEPARAEGVEFTSAALAEVFGMTDGYPYFVQEWGYQLWNLADSSPIDVDVVHAATPIVVDRLDENFFRVRYDRLTPNERHFLRAMAELGPGPHRTGDVADVIGVPISRIGPLRAQLIRKGMIYSPAHGDLAFTVPLFDDFMVRAIPTFTRSA